VRICIRDVRGGKNEIGNVEFTEVPYASGTPKQGILMEREGDL